MYHLIIVIFKFQNMKKVLPIALILVLAGVVYAFVAGPSNPTETTSTEEGLKWYSWEEAVAASKKDGKKVMVDVYTDWCGWCKRMDKTTFSNDEVSAYLAKNFYAVKLDAEQKEDIVYDGHTFSFQPSGRRGAHQLAIQLLNGRMSYPSIVYLNEDFEIITASPGYKTPEGIMNELTFIAEEHYKDTSWQEFMEGRSGK